MVAAAAEVSNKAGRDDFLRDTVQRRLHLPPITMSPTPTPRGNDE